MSLGSVTHRIPRQIIAGDTLEFLVAVPDAYRTWTGAARLTGYGQMDATSVTTSGTDFRVRFAGQGSGARTATLPAGAYMCTVWATSGDDRVTLLQSPITIAADLSTGAPDEPHCVKMLRVIERAIHARVSGTPDGGLEGYTIDGTSATKIPLPTLERLRNKYAAEVQALQNPNGQFPRIQFTFAPAGGPLDLRRRFG